MTDSEWNIVAGLLLTERGRKSRPAHDIRRYLSGILHVLRVGCPWRDMHERYGKWNSVYVRFRRWAKQGVWDALLETLVELGLTDLAPKFYPVLSSFLALVTCPPILGHPELEFSGFKAQVGGGADEPFSSDIGTLLPMALCGRTSL